MKHRLTHKILAVFSIAALLSAMSGTAALAAPATSDIDLSHLFPVTKDETVYVKTDQSGKAKSIIVSDQLTGTGDAGKLKDTSSLKNIENVKGKESFKQSGDQLTWNNKGEDIVYQGESDQALPVSYTVSYELDGKAISPEKLEGKSGHLLVRYDYKNDQSLTGDRFTPFLTVTGAILDMEHFKNVKLSANGHFESDGQRKVIIGYSIPGLLNYLGIDESEATLSDRVSLSDSFSYEADVTDYEAPTGSTLVTNEVFSQLDGGDAISSVDDLESDMNKLADASSQLVNGSSVLSDGVKKLQNGTGTLSDGVKQLAGGGKDLASGADKLASGADQLNSGISQAATGAQGVSDGIGVVHTNLEKLAAGAQSVSAGISGLADGAQQLAASMLIAKSSVDQLKSLASAVDTSKLSAADQECLDQLITGLSSLSTSLSAASEGTLYGGALALKNGADKLKEEGADPLAAGLAQMNAATAANSELARGAAAVAQALSSSGGIGAGAAAVKNGSKDLNSGASQLAGGLNTLNDKVPALTSGVDQLASGAGKLADGMAQFDSEGIQKLVGYMDGDLGSLLKKASEMTDNAKQYNNYSGISADMDGKVKFIFVQD